MEYARITAALRRRRWMILGMVAACTGVVAVSMSRMPREYLASATLMPQEQALVTLSEAATPADVAQDKDDLLGREDRLKTVAAVLGSPGVLAPVIRELGLKTTPAELQEQLEVKPVTSQVLRVSARDADPRRAEALVNGIVDTFVRFYTGLRGQEALKQIETMETERQSAQTELQDAGAALERFKRRYNISSYSDQVREGLEQSGRLADARNTAEAQLREVSAQLSTVEQQLSRTPPTREIRESGTRTALVESLTQDVARLKTELAQQLARRTEAHPEVLALQERLNEAQQRLDRESSRLHTTVRVVANPDRELLLGRVRELRSNRDGLAARVRRLNTELASAQRAISGFSGKDVQLGLLTQRYTLAENRLTMVNTRLSQLRGAANLLSSGRPIAVVNRAGPENPAVDLSQGRALRFTLLAFLMSLGMCVAIAIGLEMADRRVRSVEDAEMLTQLPVVSVVPQLSDRVSASSLCVTTEKDPASHLAEAYHFLANHVLRQTLRNSSTVLMGATARPGQGATTALTNLAIALARAGRHVVLVEADLRRPFLHEVFDRDGKPGLTDVLQGRTGLLDALVPTGVDNLRLLPAGSTVPDPWSLLWQPSMAATVDGLREAADYILFNVPSATVFADALCVAPHVDGAILVMRTSEMPGGAEQKVREWLAEVEVPVMGVVLNGVPSRDMESFEFHRSYTARRADVPEQALPSPASPPVRRTA